MKPGPPCTIRTRRLILRPLAPADYRAWAESYRNLQPPRSKYDRIPARPMDRAEFRRVLARFAWLRRRNGTLVWSIFERRTGAHIGRVDVHVLSRGPLQVANLGYLVLNTHWRRGYAREAVLAVMPRVLRDLRLHRLEAVIDPDNRASIALARSVGMRREGVRMRYYYQRGGWADQVVYAIDREDLELPTLHPERPAPTARARTKVPRASG
jgi:RimJ/RimL family protein N-acetyltransferase